VDAGGGAVIHTRDPFGPVAFEEYLASLSPLGRFAVLHGWKPRGSMVPGARRYQADYYTRWRAADIYWHEMNAARKDRQTPWLRRTWWVITTGGMACQMIGALGLGLLILAALGGNIIYFGHAIVTGQP
jgi:hypothetical protein